MEKSIPSEPTAEETTELLAAIERNLREIEELRNRMARDQVEIERSRERTRAILDQLKGV